MNPSARELYELSDGGRLSYDEVVARQKVKADWEARLAAEQRAKGEKQRQRQAAAKIAQDKYERTPEGFEALFAKWFNNRNPKGFASGMGKAAILKRFQQLGWSEQQLKDEAIARGMLPLPDHMKHGSLAAVRSNFESELARTGRQEVLVRQKINPSEKMDHQRLRSMEMEYEDQVKKLEKNLNNLVDHNRRSIEERKRAEARGSLPDPHSARYPEALAKVLGPMLRPQ